VVKSGLKTFGGDRQFLVQIVFAFARLSIEKLMHTPPSHIFCIIFARSLTLLDYIERLKFEFK
jgi:hypothetical protein